MDGKVTVRVLKDLVEKFVQEREWAQFHDPKNLSMALAGEAAELMEHFQWMTRDESQEIMNNKTFRSEVLDELADIIIYALAFANRNKVDLDTIIRKKMRKNHQKYPAKRFRGRFKN